MFSPAGAAALHTSTEHPVPASRRPLRSAVRRAACPSGAVASARKDSSPQQKAKLVGADGAAATRRGVLLSGILGGWFASVACVDRARADDRSSAADERQGKLATLQAEAASAFSRQDFATADAALTELVRCRHCGFVSHGPGPSVSTRVNHQIALDPDNYSWLEGRAQVRVDAKRFEGAIQDYESALAAVLAQGLGGGGAEARLRSGRALAFEGISLWQEALEDYDAGLAAAKRGGFLPDPYILNSRGNVLARTSLGRWEDARESYLQSAEIFQSSKGFRKGASTTQRLDGAIYASANAALMRAQLGDDAGALRDIEGVARRAPNSADMRAAVAALLWGMGRRAEAEDAWQDACTRNEGCVRYKDLDFVRRIRRWPPVMVTKLENFLAVRQPE